MIVFCNCRIDHSPVFHRDRLLQEVQRVRHYLLGQLLLCVRVHLGDHLHPVRDWDARGKNR